jgi:8-oxo-dGTP pyrophosphatase MutT (NUDIX family)
MEHNNLRAVGGMLLARETSRVLYLLRDQDTYSNTWGLVGGKVEQGETAMDALRREMIEELGRLPDILKTIPVELFTSEDGHFQYHTYVCVIDHEFIPQLSSEHKGYCWCALDAAPKPLHPGLYSALNTKEMRHKFRTLANVLDL